MTAVRWRSLKETIMRMRTLSKKIVRWRSPKEIIVSWRTVEDCKGKAWKKVYELEAQRGIVIKLGRPKGQ